MTPLATAVRTQISADHDALGAGAAALVRLAADRRFDDAIALVRRLRSRVALHVSGSVDSIGSLAPLPGVDADGLRDDARRLRRRLTALLQALGRHDVPAVVNGAHALQDLIDEHAARELVMINRQTG
jgi:hypothetical protein